MQPVDERFKRHRYDHQPDVDLHAQQRQDSRKCGERSTGDRTSPIKSSIPQINQVDNEAYDGLATALTR